MNIFLTCQKTLDANKYLEDIMDVKLILVTDVPDIGLYLPPESYVDAYHLSKMISIKADVYKFHALLEKDDKGTIYIPTDISGRVNTGDVIYEYFDAPIYFIENIRIRRQFSLQIINQCNRSCKWCPPFHRRPAPVERISYETLDLIMDMIESYGLSYTKEIQLSRICEPTYDIDFLYDVSKYIKNRFPNMKLCIITNGDWIRTTPLDVVIEKLKYINDVRINDYDNDDGSTWVLDTHGDTRGGTINNVHLRPEPHCWDMEVRASFDVNGDLMSCTQVTKIDPNHIDHVVGNIRDYPDWESMQDAMTAWKMIDSCTHCVETVCQMRKKWTPEHGAQHPSNTSLPNFTPPTSIYDKIDIVEVK